MVKRVASPCIASLAAIWTAFTFHDASAIDNKRPAIDKQLKIVAGMPPGAGVDAYARLVQRHLGNFIAGSPSIVVQNLPGAGSLRSVQSLTNTSTDEIVMNIFSSSLISDAISEPERTKVDFRRFKFIGNVAEDSRVCFVRSAIGIKTMTELMSAPNSIHFGATAPGTSGNLDTAILKKLFGVNLRQIRGYSGAADKRIALERGEIDGDCAGVTSIPEEWFKNGLIDILVRWSPTPMPGIKSNAPFGGDLLVDTMSRRVFNFLVAPQQLGRLFMVSERTRPEYVSMLRAAFNEMVASNSFLDDANARRLLVTPTAGEEVDRRIAELYQTPPDVLQKAKDIVRD